MMRKITHDAQTAAKATETPSSRPPQPDAEQRAAAPVDQLLFLQRTAGNQAVESVRTAVQTPGRPIDPSTRSLMETRFGRDFGSVRLHTDGRAEESASALQAQAYTVGRDVVFGAGQYAPQTTAGRTLLAHELAHTIQQRDGAAAPPSNDHAGAHETSARSAAHSVAAGRSAATAQPAAGPGLSMSPDDDERARLAAEAEAMVARSNKEEADEAERDKREAEEKDKREEEARRNMFVLPTTSSLIPTDPRWDPDRLAKGPDDPDWKAYVAQRDDEELKRRAKQEVEDETRGERFTSLRQQLDAHGYSRRDLVPFMMKHYSMRDLQILRHYGLEWATWRTTGNTFKNRIIAAIDRYNAEEHNQRYGGAATMKEWTKADQEAQQKQEAQKEFYAAWLEGWSHVTGSVLGGASAWIASKFTDDPKKITAAAKFGTALSGSLGSVGQAKAQQGSYTPDVVQPESPPSSTGQWRYSGEAPTKDVPVKTPDPLSVPQGTDITHGKAFWGNMVPTKVTDPSFADVSTQIGAEAPGTIRHRSTADAAAVARASGLESAKRPGFQTHSTASTVRVAFNISGRQWESAHIVPQAVYRRLRRQGFQVSPGRAFTTLLPKRAHNAFDSSWVAEWNAAKDAGRPIRAGDVFDWVSRAINRVDNSIISPDVKGAINDRLRTELYVDLGLDPTTVIVQGRP